MFAAATGLRPEEWQALERRDLDRRAGVVNVLRTVSGGEVVELAKTKHQSTPGAALAASVCGGRRDAPTPNYASDLPGAERRLLNLDN